MNTSNPSAGVYPSELDLSFRATAMGTSTGAIIGQAQRGPIGKRVLVTDNEEFRKIFGDVNARRYGFMGHSALAFLKESTSLYVTRVANGALTAGAFLTVDDPDANTPRLLLANFDDGSNNPMGKDDPMETLGFNVGDSGLEHTLMFVCCANPGIWNNKISVRIRPSNPNGLPVGQGHDTKTFYLDVFEDYKGTRSIPVESFLVSRERKIGPNGKQLFIEDVINNQSDYIRVRNNPHCAQINILEPIFEFLDGGTDGDRATDSDIIKAWDLYDDREAVIVTMLINGGYATPAVHRKMNEIAETRGDAIAILDLPSNAYRTTDAIRYRRNELNLNSSYSALYGPELQVQDTITNGKKMWLPASGFAAAAYAYTDRNAAEWFAPAGIRRGRLNIVGVRTTYSLGHRDALDQAQINYVRFIPNQGYVLWNQATLQSSDSAFSNINVRRLINRLKYAISDACEVGVFDPNDEVLRATLRGIAESILAPVMRGRGLYDYQVVCDERNNKNDTIANGDLHLDVIADPVIPAKRIHLRANIMPTGVTYEES